MWNAGGNAWPNPAAAFGGMGQQQGNMTMMPMFAMGQNPMMMGGMNAAAAMMGGGMGPNNMMGAGMGQNAALMGGGTGPNAAMMMGMGGQIMGQNAANNAKSGGGGNGATLKGTQGDNHQASWNNFMNNQVPGVKYHRRLLCIIGISVVDPYRRKG
jgi:hypothetical protein